MSMNWLKNIFQKSPTRLKEADAKVFFQEKRFRSLIENSSEGILLLSKDGKSTYISPSIKRILGYNEDEALQANIFSLSHPDDLPELNRVFQKVLLDQQTAVHQYTGRLRNYQGEWRWLEAKVKNLLSDPDIKGVLANFVDVTEKRAATEKLLQANRLYAFLSQINKAIVHAATEQALFDEVCRIAVAYGGLDIAWIGKTDPGLEKVDLLASRGLSVEEIALVEQMMQTDPGIKDALSKERGFFVCNDLQKTEVEIWRQVAEERKINSLLAFPLIKDKQIYGCISLYSSKVNFFSQKEIELLEEATEDICFALDVFEKDKKRLAMEKELLHKDARYRQAQAIAHVGSWELDLATETFLCSEEACRIYGVPVEKPEYTFEYWSSFVHPEDFEKVMAMMQDSLEELRDQASDFRIIRKDGGVRHLFLQSKVVLDDFGEVKGIYGVIHDQTDVRIAEVMAHQSKKELENLAGFNQSLLESAPVGIASFHVQSGRCLSVNPAFADIIGAPREELVGLDFREIPSWHEYGLLQDAAHTIATGEITQKEVFFRSSFGIESWVNYRFVRFFNSEEPHLLLLINDTTERKQAEEALKNSEFQFRTMVETAQEGIWLIDQNHTTQFINKMMCDMLGYAPEEMEGKVIYGFMEEETKRIAINTIGQPNAPAKHENVVFLTKDGRRVITLLSSTQFFDKEGHFTGALAMIVDMTEKAQLEDLLDRTNRISGIGNYEIDLVNQTVYWSEITREIMEVEPDFIPSLEDIRNFYTNWGDKVVANENVVNLVKLGKPCDEELQVLTYKGNVKWVRIIGEAEFKNGSCLRVYGSCQDIDERKKSQLEILKVYEEKNDILESIADAFYALDKNWIVTYWNKEAESLLKRQRSEIINKNLWEEYPHLIGSPFYEYYRIAMGESKVQQFVMYYDPLQMWFDISVYPTTNGISVYFKDVTEAKIAEAKMRELNRNLKKYTHELVVSNANLEQFSYIISHNLRTPVANIIGLSSMVSDESLPADQKELINEELVASATALDEVIMDLNLILKEKQQINRSKEMVAFSNLVKSIRNSISNLIQSEKVEIITDFSEIGEYFTIKSYFYSIFYNLIVNSIKYKHPERSPMIKISSRKIRNKVVLSFQDNGSGIDLDKKKDQIFKLYKRFHRHIEGKGMGLFLVKTQVEALGGSINVKSQPTQGTVFELEFPTTSRT